MEIKKVSDAALFAIEIAQKLNVPVCLTVIDTGANPVYTIRMEDANFMTLESAFRKAKTAFLFKCPSHVLANIVQQVPKFAKEIDKLPGDAMMIEGGLPIEQNGKFIGGVGVAGGNFEQDLAIASAFMQNFLSEVI